MSLFSRFKAIEDNGKAYAVRRLMESSTPDFDYFFMVTVSVGMATAGLLLDNTSIVIGSMLIAPVLYPILSLALGLNMSDYQVMSRSFYTIVKSLALGVGCSAAITFLFGRNVVVAEEILSRTENSILFVVVAVLAGLAASFALAKPELNESFPGIAISVALIPPLAVVGIGIAMLDPAIISGSAVMLLINIFGITAAGLLTFSLMDLHDKKHIAKSTIKKEEEKIQEAKQTMEEIDTQAKEEVAKNGEQKVDQQQ